MDYIMRSLDILLFLSIPQAFFYTWFVFLFWGIQTDRLLVRIVWFCVIHSIYLDLTFLALPSHIHILNSLVSFFFFLHLFFREFTIKVKLLIQMSLFFVVILMDTLSLITTSLFIDVELIRNGPTIYKIIFIWPYFAVVAGLCWFLHYKRYYPALKIKKFITAAQGTPIFYLVILVFIQSLILGIYFITRFTTEYDEAMMVLFYLGLAATVAVTFMTIRIIIKTREEAIQMTQSVYVGDLMQMLTSIRGQRHDFMNHIQVISSMVTMKKYDQLQKYIAEVTVDLNASHVTNKQLPTSAISALVQAKSAIALDKKIDFHYEFPESLEPLMFIKNIDLVRMIGNLIDNAFDEALNHPEQNRFVRLIIELDSRNVIIRVINHGKTLTDEDKRMIFMPGYTTKEESHSGLGLSIIQELVKRYNGNVTCVSDEEHRVEFMIQLPLSG
ncbi:sensor histidine kinase [Paenibacillus abyssi]|uniref:histidine kinase n=1 Tax=Paenibacillus abyssi TaxID=1340531 RepID=A0A917G7E4_9BACL|nr:GHKL domain-containing protein [Paenibacillus abyssi]GGG26509.1 hypothetical protein GCM10010916_48640 [Paenibacillus abyssi]